MKIIENVKNWYLTKLTGKTEIEREYEQWYLDTVNLKATYIKDMFVSELFFMDFKYSLAINFVFSTFLKK